MMRCIVQINFSNVSLVNQLLTNNNVTGTLQWPREPRVVYSVTVLPETLHTELTNAMTIMINLTIYSIQYNICMVSNLCGVTTTKVLNYGEYEITHAWRPLASKK